MMMKGKSRFVYSALARHVSTSAYFDLKKDGSAARLETNLTGMAALRIPQINKGAAFTHQEREALHLQGLLPPTVKTMKQQLDRTYRSYKTIRSPLEKYQYLRSLQERNEHLYYAFVVEHLEEVLPIIYTPTVGEACMNYSYLYNYPRGIAFSVQNIDKAESILQEYHLKDVRTVVVTDSSAVLGLGDQGFGGIGIPIGKLSVYTAAGGVSPFRTCPIALDVGTNRTDLLNDPMYLGVKSQRLTGKPYFDLVEKFVKAVKKVWPKAMIQWEDLSKQLAFGVMERFRDEVCTFSDDIQGTGACVLAGVSTGCRKLGKKLSDMRIVISGAGAGGVGVARALLEGMVREGTSVEEARSRIWMVDSTGLLYHGRHKLESYKQEFAQPASVLDSMPQRSGEIPTLLETVIASNCTCLIGLSGRPGSFTESVVRAVSANTPTPIVMPLSNPTSSAEAFPVDVVEWSDNTASVACGSPFGDVQPLYGKETPVRQGNNAFIFPGLGAAVGVVGATKVTDNMVMEAGYAVADYCCEKWPQPKVLYPPMSEVRKVSREVAKRVALQAVKDGVAADVAPGESEQSILSRLDAAYWEPVYPEVVKA